MITKLACLTLSLGIAIGTFSPVLSSVPLEIVSVNQQPELGLDDQLWGDAGQKGDRLALLASIDHSLTYLRSPKAARDYRRYPVSGITRARVIRSLERFRELVNTSRSAAELQAAVQREFVFYQSPGNDRRGTVIFTGYYEPIYEASLTPDATYRYPLYRLPPNFNRWRRPYPTRLQLEGEDGLQGANGPLRGLEIAWLRDRFEAFLVHIQGSAQLRLTDGRILTVGFGGKTEFPYVSIGRELIKDGKMPLEGLSMRALIDYFHQYPEELNVYLPRYKTFVFFQETNGAPAMGSIRVPITPERSIATDKSLMPPGALALIRTKIPYPNDQGQMEFRLANRFVLDQDTGGAIKGPGRVDIFMGSGLEAGERAGRIKNEGQLYYLLLKE